MTRRFNFPAALVAAGLLCANMPAQAGLFDDDVARKQITDLQKLSSQSLIDQSRQLDLLNQQMAELRGQVEVLVNKIGELDKRQKQLYMDIDTRLQPFETNKYKAIPTQITPPAEKPTPPPPVEARPIEKAEVQPVVIPQTPPVINAQPLTPQVDPVAAKQAYETALNLFKAGKYQDAANAFNQFGQNYGNSEQAPAAQFWLGNSYYALGDCIQVIISQQKLLAKWPTNTRAPDAMINIANCQAELGQKAESQKTLKDLITKYPDSKAAVAAKQQIK